MECYGKSGIPLSVEVSLCKDGSRLVCKNRLSSV